MKSIHISPPKPLSWFLIALPIATVLVLNITPHLSSIFDKDSLQAPYRYPFTQNLPGTNNRRAAIQQEIAFYQQKVNQDPSSGLQTASLAQAYLRMAKATGESSWYLLAEQTAKRSLSNLPIQNDGAVLALARIAQARHDFAAALSLAQQVLKSQSDNEDALAVVVTANLATGNLPAASRAAETLVNHIPTQGNLTLQALVKVAQGKDQEALDTFNLALSVEEPGETGTSAWTRVLLGQYSYKHGQLELAEKFYKEAWRILPRYPLALLNLAELETRRGNYTAAARYYDQVIPDSQATTTIFDHVVLRGRARIMQLQGKQAEAIALLNQAETLLRQETAAGHSNGNFGHRRELARLLLERDQPEAVAEALSLMQEEAGIRRDAQTLDSFAWALSRSGRWQEAQKIIQEALRLGTRDAGIFYRAASIEKALGNQQQAEAYAQLAKAVDSTFDEQARRAVGVENFGL